MMTLRSGKWLGGDGLTIELYRCFWKCLSGPLYKMLQQAVCDGRLNLMGRHEIINLIPKKQHDELLIKNWHPITLLNCDYKIWAKSLSNQLEMVTPTLIGPQQCGFVKRRSIFTNIRTTAEIVAATKKVGIPGIIVLIDFEKCFDRVEYQSIRGAFEYFGFGNGFIRKLFLLFNDLLMCTSNQGFLSDYLCKTRGTNQGCPVSPQIFNYCSEIMTHMIFQNENIHGINVNGIGQTLSQFADDTSVYLKYERLCLEEFTKTLVCVESQLGLKISYEKTTVYRIGSLWNTEVRLYTQKRVNMVKRPN